jgi:hypothetical protein
LLQQEGRSAILDVNLLLFLSICQYDTLHTVDLTSAVLLMAKWASGPSPRAQRSPPRGDVSLKDTLILTSEYLSVKKFLGSLALDMNRMVEGKVRGTGRGRGRRGAGLPPYFGPAPSSTLKP